MKRQGIGIILGLALIALPFCAFADGQVNNSDTSWQQGQGQQPPANQVNDNRLPPVIPGESVETGSGTRSKVWSSSGPVPVSSPPEPWKNSNNNPNMNGAPNLGGIGVIVDGRSGGRR